MNIEPVQNFAATNRCAYKRALIECFAFQNYTHTLTLTWNRAVSTQRAREHLRKLHGYVDERLLGRRFHRKPPDERSEAVFVVEKPEDNFHVHSLWRVRRQHLLKFHRLFLGETGGLWQEIVPSGTHFLRILSDNMAASSYILKDQHVLSHDQTIIWSHDFLPGNR